MPRVTHAAPHLSLDEVRQRRDATTHSWHRRAWDVVFTALADPRAAATIATQLGVSKDFVHRVIARYNRRGPDAFLGPGSGGRQYAYLSAADETALLAPFVTQAAAGDLPTTATIQQAFEARVGHSVAPSTIYRLLKRHHWRKVQPRPQHPQSTPEARATWKKTFRHR